MTAARGTLPRLYGAPVRERRPAAVSTFLTAVVNPGRWVLDSSSDDESSAHNRASYLRRREAALDRPGARGTYTMRYVLEETPEGRRWNVLVRWNPKRRGKGSR